MDDGEDLAGLRVLIVEDEFLLAMELETLVECSGCTAVGPASSVRQALALIDGEEPDIALLDVDLKGERDAGGGGAAGARRALRADHRLQRCAAERAGAAPRAARR